MASFSIAVDRKFKRDGEPEADFFNCTAFNKTAEFVEKYCKKGTKMVVEGRVQNDNYEKDGVKHYGVKIMVDSLEFAESKSANSAPSTKVETSDDGFMNAASGLTEELPFT
ncbi:single-stranded DNA-binding protein [Staphylococcus epidermidis]|uniref:single-stranded DNA-binding protein n=1 Tax=Staphylococcus epidermidis TaxID=1282 RepID=UPI003DA36A71